MPRARATQRVPPASWASLPSRPACPTSWRRGCSRGRAYPVAVRFAQGPGETLGDYVSTHRGMAIKVFGVPGERLPGHDVDTQDFVLATGTTFPSGTEACFLRDGTVTGNSAGLPEGVKSAVSSAARNLNRALHALGTESALADFFGHPYSHPLADGYFSQAPSRGRGTTMECPPRMRGQHPLPGINGKASDNP